MFFTLSKILWLMIAPSNLIAMCLIIGFLGLIFRFFKTGFWILGTGIVGLIIFGIFPMGHNIAVYLENRSMPRGDVPTECRGVIMLGGVFDPYLSALRNRPQAGSTVDRLHVFHELGRTMPQDVQFYMTGGVGDLQQNGVSEAILVQKYFETIGFDRNVIYEGQSRNTYENAVFLAKQIEHHHQGCFVLITSATHMLRAKYVFRSYGYNIEPYMADYVTDGFYRWKPIFGNVSDNLKMTDYVMKEIIGFFAYAVTGKLSIISE